MPTPLLHWRPQNPRLQSTVQVALQVIVQWAELLQVIALSLPIETMQVAASQVTAPSAPTVTVQLLLASHFTLPPLPAVSVQNAPRVQDMVPPAPSTKVQVESWSQLVLQPPPQTPFKQVAFSAQERLQLIVVSLQALDEKSQLSLAGQLQLVPAQVRPPHAKLATATATARAAS
jgi:hypothetical protein